MKRCQMWFFADTLQSFNWGLEIMKSVAVIAALSSGALAYCPPSGPVLPPPSISSASLDLSSLQSKLGLLGSGPLTWNLTTSSFSIGITSRDATVFEFHHTAQVLDVTSTKKVDKDTVYRVASITKAITVLLNLLVAPSRLDDPIGKYVPEVNVEGWADITLRKLASQMAGIPRDGNFDLDQTIFYADICSQHV